MRTPETHVPFPGVAFASQSEFAAFCTHSQAELDARYLLERALALPDGDHIRTGTCAPCLRQAQFALSTDHGERLSSGLMVPNWREQLVCDCPDRLNNRHRALLHFVESAIGVASWQRVLAFGRMSPAEIRLCERLGERISVPRPSVDARGAHRVAVPDASCHLAVSLDYLHHLPGLSAVLAELRRALVPGGALVFTVPFRWDRATTRIHADVTAVESLREVNEIGWDVLDMLRGAGFARSHVHVYWSTELGYLGPFNTLFSAET